MATNSDPGLTVRVPVALLPELRDMAKKIAKKNPILTETEVLRRLGTRAVEAGVRAILDGSVTL